MTNDNTRIEWTDATWNPTTGCSKVSDGCRFCYAEAVSHRFGHTSKPWTAPHAVEKVALHPDRLDQPLRWRKSRRIFVDSMSDLFHEQVPDDFIEEVFAVMARAERHTFQILTKRPKRMRDFLVSPQRSRWLSMRLPLSNVWLGTSVEDQRVADERIGALVQTPAAIRFLSCEPLIGPLSLEGFLIPWFAADDPRYYEPGGRGVDWVIVGGESGPNHRPIEERWVRGLRDECQEAGVAFFFKQWGGRTPKAGGRLLDGVTWDEMPAVTS